MELPADDAPHAGVTTEWWYYNGHLLTGDGRQFGFHYVVFQVRTPGGVRGRIAHFSISDPEAAVYATDQRGALLGQGPEEAYGFAFDLGGWSMAGSDGRDSLSASAGGYAFRLDLRPGKPPVLHNQSGLVDFGQQITSYYYSRTRLEASGTLTVLGQALPVRGTAWFDHQWGNFETRSVGWDWFALQLDDGSDVMLSVLRDRAGDILYRYGTFVAADGAARQLATEDFEVSSARQWRSQASDATYPVGWRVRVPGRGIDVTLAPLLEASEFDARRTTGNFYWEGGVRVRGTHSGLGFVELVGYAPLAASTP